MLVKKTKKANSKSRHLKKCVIFPVIVWSQSLNGENYGYFKKT